MTHDDEIDDFLAWVDRPNRTDDPDPEPEREPDPEPQFQVIPFKPLALDSRRVLFHVYGPDDRLREITVERSRRGDGYEFLVDGDGYYDAETEPAHLTAFLIDMTDAILLDQPPHWDERKVSARDMSKALSRAEGILTRAWGAWSITPPGHGLVQ